MPELPEVEVIRLQLEQHILHKKISKVETWLPKMWRNIPAEMGEQLIVGREFTKISRKGKYLVFQFDDGMIMIGHLKMTGRLVYLPKYKVRKHDRIGFTFTSGDGLLFGDIRTFGGLYLYKNKESIDLKGYLSLGVEPLSSKFTGKLLYDYLQKSSLQIKTFLLNQHYVAGIGNIYADESLFRAHILPTRRTYTITLEEAKRLQRAIRYVLKQGLEHGGTSFRDYQNGEGKKGFNQDFLQVYSRGNKPCIHCKHTLNEVIINGRRSVYCGKCQK